ncbi:putative zinc-binding protein [Natrialbaceae archaeon GCM10025810]|uniref:putative zinc-binding protein n=1 Tax=Halovalidus salilacus TaxID=3075124 RepID=UPI00360C6A4D
MTDPYADLPLVYSCSGCSSAAQLANDVAVSLDREEVAEMSCIAGVGGGVAPLVATATSGRPIVAIDGCPLECTRHCLEKHDVSPDLHYVLSEEGVRKEYHADYDEEQAETIRREVAAAVEDLEAT